MLMSVPKKSAVNFARTQMVVTNAAVSLDMNLKTINAKVHTISMEIRLFLSESSKSSVG